MLAHRSLTEQASLQTCFILGRAILCLPVKWAVNTINCEAWGFSPKNQFQMATILPGLEIGERYMKAQASSMHKLYTVKSIKKLHNCCQSMQSLQECCMGPSLSEQRKHSQTPFPQCYHIRTSLVGKFLIYAVIFFLLWYRQGFNIQMPFDPATYPQISPLFPFGLQPSARQQIVLTRSRSNGSVLSVDR